MQATSTVRGTGISRSAAGFLLGLMAALLIGAVAGFAAKTWTAGSSSTTTGKSVVIAHQQAPDAMERNAQVRDAQVGGPQSDLTRALPTAAPGLVDRAAERQPAASEYVSGGYYIP